MADSNKAETKFGFKDKEKALETLQLLESHDMQYRKLTVRGLLSRAKRVVTVTKADEKVKNINEAIEVFENWLDENGGGASNKNVATNEDDKVETVPGLGFKNKEAAMATLEILRDRDPEYQKFAIKGLIGSSKRVLSGTKNEEKIQSIQEGVKILQEFLEKFEAENMMRLNRAYLAYSVIEQLPMPENGLAAEFLQAYGGEKAKGNYKHLRTMFPNEGDGKSWDIVRNRNIASILEEIKAEDAKLFDEKDEKPTDHHMKLIHWAYSPQPDKVKAFVAKHATKLEGKRKGQNDNENNDIESETPPKKKKIQ